MLEGAGHALDLGRASPDRLGGVTPGRCHGSNLFDDRAGLRQCKCEEFRGALQRNVRLTAAGGL